MSDSRPSREESEGYLPDEVSYRPSPPAPEGYWQRVGALAAVAGVLATVGVGVVQSGVLSQPTQVQTGPVLPPPEDGADTEETSADAGAAAMLTAATTSDRGVEQPDEQPSEPPEPNPEPSVAIGRCFSAEGEATDCAGAYAAQAFAEEAPCERPDLDSFLSLTSRDVLRPDLDLAWHDDRGCVVSLAGHGLEGSLQGAFSDPRSDTAAQLRHCLDSDLRTISCTQPHHGEVVGHHDDAQQCTAVALSYMGRDGGRFPAGDLGLTARGDECLVTVKGANALHFTLRDLGRRTLPIEARS